MDYCRPMPHVRANQPRVRHASRPRRNHGPGTSIVLVTHSVRVIGGIKCVADFTGARFGIGTLEGIYLGDDLNV